MKTILFSTAAAILVAGSAFADGHAINAAEFGMSEFSLGVLGGENVEDATRKVQCVADYISVGLSIPVNVFVAEDYAGVLEGFLGGTVDMAELGASGYANVFLTDASAVEPLVVAQQLDGSTGYFSEILVRTDSGIETFEDLEGRSFYFGDPNSTSGTLVPTVAFKEMGLVAAEYFSEVGFSGGHEQSVVGVYNGDFDASGTWISGQGSFEEGYTRGGLRKSVENGLVDISELKPVWRSPEIPEGPMTVRQALPTEVKAKLTEMFMAFPTDNPGCMETNAGEINGYVDADHSRYEFIVEMRRDTFGG